MKKSQTYLGSLLRRILLASIGFFFLVGTAQAIHLSDKLNAELKEEKAKLLSKLSGRKLEYLEKLKAKGVTFGLNHVAGLVEINHVPALAVIFRDHPKAKPHIALLFEKPLKLEKFNPALKSTPLSDLVLKKAAFIFSAPHASGEKIHLPKPMQDYLGIDALARSHGLSLYAGADLYGDSARLVK